MAAVKTLVVIVVSGVRVFVKTASSYTPPGGGADVVNDTVGDTV